jgi:hypothetical protein
MAFVSGIYLLSNGRAHSEIGSHTVRFSTHKTQACPCRLRFTAQLGRSGRDMTEREAEIAAKIARLKGQRGMRAGPKSGPGPGSKTEISNADRADKGSESGLPQAADNRLDEDVDPTGVVENDCSDNSEGASSTRVKRTVPTTMPNTFDALPDWKKEEVLLKEMEAAETFLRTKAPIRMSSPTSVSSVTDTVLFPDEVETAGKAEKDSEARDGAADQTGTKHVPSAPSSRRSPEGEPGIAYKPKVKTWGVFPRPENISDAYGGGKNIPIGGKVIPRDDPDALRRDQEIQARLARYRKGQGIDMEREKKHEPEIAAALAQAEKCMTRALPYDAVRQLEAVQEYVSPRSQRGGDVYMNLALAYEATGQRELARTVYLKLKGSPFQHISRQAKRLLSGFDAMEKLRLKDDVHEDGLRVTSFTLPDVAAYTDKRYETAVFIPANLTKKQGDEKSANAQDHSVLAVVVVSLIALPIAFIVGKLLG